MSWQQQITQQLQIIQTWISNVQANTKKIFDFVTVSSVSGADYVPISINGETKKVSLATLAAFVDSVILFKENQYTDIDDLLANQGEQTSGKIQFVLDATDDPNVNPGPDDPIYAYYEYLGTANGAISDYRKLSSDEVQALESSNDFNVFNVRELGTSISDGVGNEYVSVQIDGSDNVVRILFSEDYSYYLNDVKALITAGDKIYLQIYNHTKNRFLKAQITSLDYSNVNNLFYLATLSPGLIASQFTVDDTLRFCIDSDKEGEGGATGDMEAVTYDPAGKTEQVLTVGDVGVANGVASLDGSGKVPSAQLPSYVDDVLEYADAASFPGAGETGKIYVAQDTNLSYRWTGSVYVKINDIDGATIKTLLFAESDTNNLTDALLAKLDALNRSYDFAISDETTDLEVDLSNPVYSDRLREPFTGCNNVRITCNVAPDGAALEFDVHKNGVSIFDYLPIIESGDFDSNDSPGVMVITGGSVNWAAGDLLEVFVTSIGSTTAGAGAKMSLQHI